MTQLTVENDIDRRSSRLALGRIFNSANHLGWLLLAAPVVFAIAAITLGKEAGWDFQNYHWYNPYALINHRLGVDIAVAHHATYYNPLLDLPLYWIATHGPAWLAGAFCGALFGVVVALQGAIAYQVIRCDSAGSRAAIAVLLAIFSAGGAGAVLALGDTANDVPATVGVFAALWILMRRFSQLRADTVTPQSAFTLLLAGVCAGLSAGLKLTTDIYALGLLAATFVTPLTWRMRCSCTLLLGIGMLCGVLAAGGWWLWRMWEYGGNPLFPYFNQWFHSPLLVNGSYRDTSFLDALDWRDKWLLPALMTIDSHCVAEAQFRDARILAAYVLVPLTSLIMVNKRQVASTVQPAMTRFLFCFAAVAYLAWLCVFGIYRYLVPLEMLVPLLITLAIMSWPISRRLRIATLLVVLLALQALVSVHTKRLEWSGSYVAVQVPPLARPQDSMILMAGNAAMAFVIPSFPHAIRFLRIDGWMVGKDDRSSGLARVMRATIARHRGPLLMLFAPLEQQRAVMAAQAYGLQLSIPSCMAVKSNIAEPLLLCSLQR